MAVLLGACLLLLLMGVPSLARDLPVEGGLADRILAAGHTDVHVERKGPVLEAAFTNQTWWRPARAVAEVLPWVAELAGDAERGCLILQRDRTAVARIEFDMATFRLWQAGLVGDERMEAALVVSRGPSVLGARSASSIGWLDCGLSPTYSLAQGLSLGVAETWRVTLGDGISLAAETQQGLLGPALAPVDTLRGAVWGWLGGDVAARATVGWIRQGWAIEGGLARQMGDLEVRVHGSAMASGAGALDAVAVFQTPWGVVLKGEAGHFLDGDDGVLASALWNFDRSQLEASAISTTSGLDFRTLLSLDLAGPRKIGASPFRLTGGEVFVPYQADRASRGRRLTYVDPFDRLFLDLHAGPILRALAADRVSRQGKGPATEQVAGPEPKEPYLAD